MAMLSPDPQRIAPGAATAAPDRVPPELAGGTPESLRAELAALVGEEQVLGRVIDLVRYAADASPYLVMPRVVVVARHGDDVAKLLAFAHRERIPITFRAGGTSLNGQSQGAGILVDVRRHFSGVAVEDGGARVRVRPGTLLGHVNRVLAAHGRRLGPDPASTEIATVGGVIANNSGGMRCGVTADSYSTVRALRFVLASGTEIDSSASDAEERFAAAEPELARGLLEIREEILADPELAERILHKFEIKNTTGYRLCAFLDAETPVEIFRRLLVGSEGTLAFIAEATFETVPKPARTTLAWLHFPSIAAATEVVPALVASGASAVELMVAPALVVAAHHIAGAPEAWKEGLPPDSAALLVEFGGARDAELDACEARAAEVVAGGELLWPAEFTRDAETIEIFWRVRDGLHGLLGRLRPPGTALMIEDVCVSPARIAAAAEEIRALLGEHGFLTGVAGHASAGNLHFMLTPDFAKPEDVGRYEAFMESLVELVLERYDGSLKAEHGTGVNMAPFVEREWGSKATELMWRAKSLADPDGVLGPGVVLNRDSGAHLRNLKTTPAIEEEATTCVECGFCEPVCPSRELTTTPRQRIVIRREMARQPEGSPVLEALREQYEYDAVETCAADGSCALACPLGIDTGKLIKQVRARQHSERAERLALRAAERWAAVESSARGGLRLGKAISGVLGEAPVRGATRALRTRVSRELVPEWGEEMPGAAPSRLPHTERAGAVAVYFPACINRIFGPPPGRQSLPEALVAVSARAGLPVWIPDDVAGRCCATPWASKGFERGAEHAAAGAVASLRRWSNDGELAVIVDASSCTQGLGEAAAAREAGLEILDSVSWAHERLLPRLTVRRRVGSAVIHPTCSLRHLGLAATLEALAGELAEEVVVPLEATCCGFAGDRGFLHPELTESATRAEAAEIRATSSEAHLASNRTCEIGLERATGKRFESFVYLLEELSR